MSFEVADSFVDPDDTGAVSDRVVADSALDDGVLWAQDTLAAQRRHAGSVPDLTGTDLGDVPPQWIDPETVGMAARAQAAVDAGLALEDTDGDGVTDAGEFLSDTDPLDPTDTRSRGWTEDFDPALGGNPDLNQSAIVD